MALWACNTCFDAAGEYEQAVAGFTTAINTFRRADVDCQGPHAHLGVLHCNRALAHLKLKQWFPVSETCIHTCSNQHRQPASITVSVSLIRTGLVFSLYLTVYAMIRRTQRTADSTYSDATDLRLNCAICHCLCTNAHWECAAKLFYLTAQHGSMPSCEQKQTLHNVS